MDKKLNFNKSVDSQKWIDTLKTYQLETNQISKRLVKVLNQYESSDVRSLAKRFISDFEKKEIQIKRYLTILGKSSSLKAEPKMRRKEIERFSKSWEGLIDCYELFLSDLKGFS